MSKRLNKLAVDRAEGILSNKVRLAMSAWEEAHPAPVAQSLSDFAIAEIAVKDPAWKHRFLASFTQTSWRDYRMCRTLFLTQSVRAAKAELRATTAYRKWTARRDAVRAKMFAASARIINRAVIGCMTPEELLAAVEGFAPTKELFGS